MAVGQLASFWLPDQDARRRSVQTLNPGSYSRGLYISQLNKVIFPILDSLFGNSPSTAFRISSAPTLHTACLTYLNYMPASSMRRKRNCRTEKKFPICNGDPLKNLASFFETIIEN